MKYVGIRSCREKRDAVSRAARDGVKVMLGMDDLIAGDCERHIGVLSGDYSQYINYYSSKSKGWIKKRIAEFLRVKTQIEKHGYDYKKGYIIVSSNGARLDGSHRAAILYYLGYDKIEVLQIEMKMTAELEDHLRSQHEKFG